jgi:ketosteroid isomerase-like protein
MKTAILAAVFVLAVTLTGISQESLSKGDEGQIRALENAWNQAEIQHDPGAVDQILTDDFMITEPDATVQTKKEHMGFMKDKSYHYDLLVSENFRIKVYGTVGIVMGTYHEKGKYKGKVFDRRGRFTDTWIKLNGTWHCVTSHDSLPVKN